MTEEPILETNKIQGNILPGFRMPHQAIFACKIKNDSDLKTFLIYIQPKITNMKEAIGYHNERIALAKKTQKFGTESFSLPNTKDLFWLNVAFGNQFISSINTDVGALDLSYNIGLAARSFHLGDPKEQTSEGNKNNWIFGNEGNEADIFLIAASDSSITLEKETAKLTSVISKYNIEILYFEKGERLEGETEHFGFKDGISQPEVRGYVNEDKEYITQRIISSGNENLNDPEFAAPGKMLLWPGQFILGYPKQSASHFRNPIEPTEIEKSDFIKNGSFLVFRRLKQDVKTFNEETNKIYNELISTAGFEDISYEDFLAKLVGRKKDGMPIGFQNTPVAHMNNFNFKANTGNYILSTGENVASVPADPTGNKCPMFAHIRKVNPRDLPTDQGAETNTATFRIMRRGIPFGKPYNFQNPNDISNQDERGLLFLCYQRSIKNQFELLTNKWMNKDSRPESLVGHDNIMGQNNEEDSGGIKWCTFNSGGQNKRLEFKTPFIIPTGGGYFFCPSLDALQSIINAIVATNTT